MDVEISESLNVDESLREVGLDAIWSLSTAKPGNGVEQLRDECLETYWQSDGTQPHLINIQFLKKVVISKICLYMDFTVDESYTPKKISIRSGTSQHDLVDIATVDLHEPVGWINISLIDQNKEPLRTHLLQVRIVSMHQNGRDTHVRNVKVYGPRSSYPVMGGIPVDRFYSSEMLQYAQIR